MTVRLMSAEASTWLGELNDSDRERLISRLGDLLCSPVATRLWRICCMAAQRDLIRGRSLTQVAKMDAQLRVRAHQDQPSGRRRK